MLFQTRIKNFDALWKTVPVITEIDNGTSVEIFISDNKWYSITYWGIDDDFPEPFIITLYSLIKENNHFPYSISYTLHHNLNKWILD